MMKRIILLLDGTWNDADFDPSDTNIVRMREIISRSLDASSALVPDVPGPRLKPGERIAAGRTFGGTVENIVFYQRGVGTDVGETIAGGVLGRGLDRNVRNAYRFLSYHYDPGDEIHVFGFSRGAFTARSMVGFVAAAGLLKRDWCNDELEGIAWSFYRTPPNERLPGVWARLSPYVHDRKRLQISCLGVFDTVGALGIPLELLRLANRSKYEFHDVELSSISRLNLHAIAIDEHRKPFEAAVWRKPKFKTLNSITEQVWFSGAHSDVGGGTVDDVERGQLGCVLDDISLNWMLRRVKRHYPDFPVRLDSDICRAVNGSWVWAPHTEPRKRQYRIFKKAYRSIANHGFDVSRWKREKVVTIDRHAEVISESVHVSAIERLGREVWHGSTRAIYRPKNLAAILPHLVATYTSEEEDLPANAIFLVDWDGEQIPRQTGKNRALSLLDTAKDRLCRPPKSFYE